MISEIVSHYISSDMFFMCLLSNREDSMKCVCCREITNDTGFFTKKHLFFSCNYMMMTMQITITVAHDTSTLENIWVWSRICSCPVTWFCYQLIAKPGDKTAAVPWPDPPTASILIQTIFHRTWLQIPHTILDKPFLVPYISPSITNIT